MNFNKKGFIFSIEALIAVILILISLLIISNYSISEMPSEIFSDKLFSEGINTIYFDEEISNENYENLYCENFVKYSGTIEQIIVCEGFD